MLRIRNLSVPFDDETPLHALAAKRLKLPPQAVLEVVVVRRAVDARRYKNAPLSFVYTLDAALAVPEQKALVKLRGDRGVAVAPQIEPVAVLYGAEKLAARPVVVGLGPAGLFAALTLAEHGYRPLVLERGRDVDRRAADVERFWRGDALDERSNVQFGEGGAGAFSDGKLTTRASDARMAEILDRLVAAGAPAEIKYLHKPHIGTDLLRGVVKNLRRRIIQLGGEVRFEAQVTDLEIRAERIAGVVANGAERVPCGALVLAIGHSARDTYELLAARGVAMEAKPFAVGVRIEHPQDWIDRAQYGKDAGHPRLPAADYALTYQDRETGRGVYSFCMCPGGQVVAAASEAGALVTNGMSLHARDSGAANSALLVAVGPGDFGPGPLDGVAFQRKYERLAFACGGGSYYAPVQTVGDFLAGRTGGRMFLTQPTYRPGVRPADLRDCLPPYVSAALGRALPHFGRKLLGFDDPAAVMTGVETRSSAPCRIRRGADFVSESVGGLYPSGEGAGYAGGIMSAALDGMRCAIALMERYAR